MEKRLLNIYIQALYLSAHKIEGIEIITESLKQFDMALQENPEFEKMLLSRSVTPEKKKEIVKLFEGKISQEVINLLYVIITKSRCFIIPHLLHEWTEKLKKNYNIRKTKVITAFDADEIVKKNIDAYLKKIDPQGSHIKTYVTDPGIIGGFKIIVGNIVYDNSFAGKLNLIKKNML